MRLTQSILAMGGYKLHTYIASYVPWSLGIQVQYHIHDFLDNSNMASLDRHCKVQVTLE